MYNPSNSRLETYFKENVELPQVRTKQIRKAIKLDVNDLAEYINRMDRRFSANVVPVGSAHQGLKVKPVNEFDFSIPLVSRHPVVLSWAEPGTVPLNVYGPCMRMNKEVHHLMDPDLMIVGSQIPLPLVYGKGYYLIANVWSDMSDFNDLMHEGFLIPFYVKRQLKKLLQTACGTKGLKMGGMIVPDNFF